MGISSYTCLLFGLSMLKSMSMARPVHRNVSTEFSISPPAHQQNLVLNFLSNVEESIQTNLSSLICSNNKYWRDLRNETDWDSSLCTEPENNSSFCVIHFTCNFMATYDATIDLLEQKIYETNDSNITFVKNNMEEALHYTCGAWVGY